ncbi:TetR/AcrR family transcriptional regulator [Hamadaea tsunoensis]|uniref:TetR/AcrR family transcriptional regulator n=1 Tax=Hamadaea tsunoensis TaxID=53368 RepID=UPI0003F6C0AA|nr:TetR/AcrR family transcriptional regulator [Hamadaea tsunoensis]
MAGRTTERREQALSRERIVAAAITLLDADGEDGLTFRALSARLATGPGAIYWHVANKNELLVAATEAVLAGATGRPDAADPAQAVRAVALAVFDAVDEHPWAGAQLSRAPAQPAMRRILERLGQQTLALGVPAADRFTSASALLNYIIGSSRQNAANARTQPPGGDRTAILAAEAAAWRTLDPDEYPFLHEIADQLPRHDDRAQFLAGVDLILAGIARLPG